MMQIFQKRHALLTLFALSAFAYAQAQIKVSGVVVDEAGMEVIGASVLEKGTQNGNVTDLDGRFEFQTVSSNPTLVISFVGYTTQEVKATTAPLRIVLAEDSQVLDEMVVVGYGVQKKSVLTGAISSVKPDDMMKTANTRPEQALQGKTSGVQVMSSSGAPGEGIKIRVRGVSSNGKADPLYIVDGLRTDDISTLEPSNIASMEVLKDGASAAIYGAEGGNGVILITTKSGKAGKTQVTYDFQYAIQSLGRTPEMMNAAKYKSYMTGAGQNIVDSKYDTDWLDEMFEAAPMMKHSLSMTGGNEKLTYFGSVSYLDHEGIVVGDQDNYKRYSGMFNGSVQATKWLKMTSSIQMNRNVKTSFSLNDESRGVIANALMLDPMTPAFYTADELTANMRNMLAAGRNLMMNGDRYYAISDNVSGECINPMVQRDLAQTRTVMNSMMANVGLEITPFKGFVFSSKFGANYNQYRAHAYRPAYYYSTEMNNSSSMVSESDYTTFYYQWENFANYNTSINDVHNLAFVVGTAVSERNFETLSASGYPLLNDSENFAHLSYLSSQTGTSASGTTIIDRKFSYFGRVNYDYKNKYLFEATIRRDAAGLSILPKDKRWGTFPAASVGWVISREEWFPKTDFITNLKLRASWGRNGSLSNLGSYSYSAAISSTLNTFSYYSWSPIVAPRQYQNADGSYSTAAQPGTLGNYNLTWETSDQWDLGIDLRMLRDRLTFGFDYYRKTTKDLITNNTPALEAGNSASPINGGDVLNKGIDIELAWNDHIGDFTYSINGNISFLSNEATRLDESISRISGASLMQWTGATAFEKGYPVWYFRGLKGKGVDPSTGQAIFEDYNGDGNINADDYQEIGSAIPDFTYGVTITLGYKGFDFTVFGAGSQGNEVLMGFRRPDRPTTNKLATFYDDAWTGAGQGAKYPSTIEQVNNTNFWNSDFMVFDGSYFKIKQIQLGYTLPKPVLAKMFLSNLRAYCSLEDFFTFTSYPGMDPEASTGDNNAQGIDRGFFPASKKVMFGLSLSF